MARECQIRATTKYNAKAYDRIQVRVKKGLGDLYKAEAEKRNMSMAELVQRALDNYIRSTADGSENN